MSVFGWDAFARIGDPILTDTPAHSFGLKTPRDMLQKLERELHRLSNATFDPNDVVDHSINCAMTEWLMVDWVWKLHFRGNDAALNELSRQGEQKRDQKRESRRASHCSMARGSCSGAVTIPIRC